jgi:hypothetical protein
MKGSVSLENKELNPYMHEKFNALHRTYASIHEKLQHYQCVMKEYLISIALQNVAALPVKVLYG